MRQVGFATLALALVQALLRAQAGANVGSPVQSPLSRIPEQLIPEALKLPLEERLALFVDLQAQNRWSEVSPMLGRYVGGDRDRVLTPTQKACLISQMQVFQLMSFEFKGVGLIPPVWAMPVSRKWFFLEGEGQIIT